MTVHIIYSNYLKPDGIGYNIGGIETYIQNLTSLLLNLKFDVIIYQKSEFEFEKNVDSYKIIGIPNDNIHTLKYDLFKACLSRCDKKNDIILFASEEYIVGKAGYKTLCIQHGISWDIPTMEKSNVQYLFCYIKKALYSWLKIHRFGKVKMLVCVDYNLVNWYRSITAYPKTLLKVVPNFTRIPDPTVMHNKPNDSIEIIFARRFQPYRGTRVFAEAITRIMNEYENVKVTIAGEGPDEQYLRDTVCANNRVNFIKYASSDSLLIHSTKHIAIVPTIGSEGTSLSLLEAMAAGCAVIASNVGGMTNIILDHYNGLLINPDADSLYYSIKELIENKTLMAEIAHNAYITASHSFSLERWQSAWANIITDFSNLHN